MNNQIANRAATTRRTIFGQLTVVALAVLTLLIAFAPAASAQFRQQQRSQLSWNSVAGRPNDVGGSSEGFYIWSENESVHIVHNRAANQRFRGEVEIDNGTLRNPRTFGGGQDNGRFTTRNSRRLVFDFEARDNVDGIKFDATDFDRITIRLTGRNSREPIYIGGTKRGVGTGTLTFVTRGGNGGGFDNRDDRYGNRNDRDGNRNNRPGNRFPGRGNRDDDDGRRSGNDGPGFPSYRGDGDYNDDYGRPAEATWRDINGRPQNIEREPGFYVWREGLTVHIVHTRRGSFARGRVAGNIRIENGQARNPRGFSDEKDDRFNVRSRDRLHFVLDGGRQTDGVKFDISSTNARMFIRVRLSGREQTYYLGSDKRRIQDVSLLIKP